MDRNPFFVGFLVLTLWVCSAQAACNPTPASYFNATSSSWQNAPAVQTPGSPDAYYIGNYTGILTVHYNSNLTLASGISVAIERKCSTTDCIDNEVMIGNVNRAESDIWSTSYTTKVFGNCTDLWGLSTSSTSFVVQISANSTSNATFNISSINVTIYYFDFTTGAITTEALTSGPVTTSQLTSGQITTNGLDVTTGIEVTTSRVPQTTGINPVTSGSSQALGVSTGSVVTPATTRAPSTTSLNVALTTGQSITSGNLVQAGTSSQPIITTSATNETSLNILTSNESTSNGDLFNFSLLYIILGAIIGVLFIAIVVLLGVYVAKRRRGGYNDPESAPSKSVEIPEIEPKELPDPDEKDLVVPITKMNQKIEKLKAQVPDLNVNGFDIEFNYIEKKTQHQPATENYTSASLPINASKNRFRNVLPPEETRVKLTPVTGIDGSDYINANYIKGLIPGSEKAYIATQGPLASTINDFWKMVWEQNTSVILNLTREFENGRLKSERYWPETKEDTFDTPDFEVKLSSMKEAEGLVVRKLILLQKETKTTREITQFHYIGWPDHGIPSHTDAYIQLAEGADTANTTNAPVVVHCSAGIGRTGTFVTIHSILELVKLYLKENPDKQIEVNIPDVVMRLRSQRTGMVQTPEQFEFTYKAIYDGIQFLLHPEMKPPALPFAEVDTAKLKKMQESGSALSNGNGAEANEEGTSEEESESMLKRSQNPPQNEIDISTSVETSER